MIRLRDMERPGKGRKVVEYVGIVDARVLGEELVHAAEWIEERFVSPARGVC